MNRQHSLLLRWTLGRGLIATCVALCLLLFTTVAVFADSVYVSDTYHILNDAQVRSAASSLPKPISIYAVNYNGSDSSFDQQARSNIKSSNMIVLAFNNHHVTVAGGSSVGLSNSQYGDARDAFISSYNSSRNYTTANIAAINSLKDSLNGGGFVPGVGGGTSRSIGGTLCCLVLVIAIVVGILAFARRRGRMQPGFFNRRPGPQAPYDQGQPYGPGPGPYNQGPYPPGYQGPYPPQNQGMNPWAAGGLGAAAGGFVGYEMGRQAGEREERDSDRDYNEGGYYGDQGGFGGGASGDFGGDQGGFGGGDQGGFGGGASGDFGGDQGGFGGDQQNNDFGGGSSGNF